ncbi:MAG: hypothetical protein U9N33_02790 [Campylobacterota bacterium]|nr:hypothetical protein [Campylobacterota bacterium]
MQIVSQSEAYRLTGVAVSIIGRYIKKGKLKRYNKSDINLDELTALRNIPSIKATEVKTKQAEDAKLKEVKTVPQNIENTEIDNEENQEELKKLLKDANTPTQVVTITKDFWLGKINEQKYLKEQGELITLDSAKGVAEVMFSPLSRKLDDLHIDLKSRFPEISLEAIDWLSNYINNIKESVSSHKWK